MTDRIWELDALRGVCILGMVAVHLVYDVVVLFGLVSWEYPAWLTLLQNWGGVLFLLLSGICVTLGSRCLRRGSLVLACGMACTAVTGGLYLLGATSREGVIWFGVLHCLGHCMLLWPVFRGLPASALGILGMILAVLGCWLNTRVRVSHDFLAPLGVTSPGFSSADYFPLLPHLGFFLLGAMLGRLLYPKKESLFPRVRCQAGPLRFLRLCGRHSLLIYLAHQPVLAAVVALAVGCGEQ